MIKFDRYSKIILTVIAMLLFTLLLRGQGTVGIQSPAYAQTATTTATQVRPKVEVVAIKDIPVQDFKEVILLGDGKTFLVRVGNGISVFQVQEYIPTTGQ